jgi:hypothetical protein
VQNSYTQEMATNGNVPIAVRQLRVLSGHFAEENAKIE